MARTTPLSHWLPAASSHVGPPLLGWPEHGFRAAWGGVALADWVVMALCVLRTGAAVLVTIGLFTPWAGTVAALAALVVASQDAFGFKFTLYTLFVGTWLVALCGGGRHHAVLAEQDHGLRRGTWPVRLFVASVYAWAGLAKLHAPWLSGETLRELHRLGYLSGSAADLLFATAERCRAAAWGVAIIELLLAPMLLCRRSRMAGAVLAIAVHAVYEWTAHPDVFGWVMVALLAAVVAPSSEHRRIAAAR